ncbi:MAG TPA: SLBB domain-containing protein [Candidatus Mcinerneyibacteriales bacterium]|nr:SLBB domain-containing protein [Candidatus Mcinerneyibacteriales bacterium]
MRRVILFLLLALLSFTSVSALTPAEQDALLQKYARGESFSPEEMEQLSEALKSYETPDSPFQARALPGQKDAAPENEEPLPASSSSQDRPFFQKYYFDESGYDYPLDISSLTLFGRRFFEAPSTYAPVTNAPVNDNYILGPGDRLRITIWGTTMTDLDVTVNTNGNISSSHFGRMSVAGLTLGGLKARLKESISTGTDFEVALTDVKTVRIFVTGDAASPGSYTLSGLASVINAVFSSGGPASTGSLRSISLNRGGRLVKTIDLYDFLLHGDSSDDISLMDGDIIHIAPMGPLVAVAGNVRRPALYEVKEGETWSDIVSLAGGMTASAYGVNISLESFETDRGRVLATLSRETLRSLSPKDGDILRVYPIPVTREDLNAVSLEGYVSTPRKFQWHEGMRFSDLVDTALLLPETYMEYATVTRREYPENTTRIYPVNLQKALFEQDPRADLPLQPEDIITLYSKKEMQDRPPVFILGEVRAPGRFQYIPGMTVVDLIHLAQGLTNTANLKEAEYVTLQVSDNRVEKIDVSVFSLSSVLNRPNDPAVNFTLKPFDKVFVRRLADFEENRAITLSGEVVYPGVYYAREGENLADILKRAGGFTSEAYIRGSVFTRESVKERQQEHLEELIRTMESTIALLESRQESRSADLLPLYRKRLEEMKNAQVTGRLIMDIPGDLNAFARSSYNIPVRNGDTLYVPRNPDAVTVMGEVNSPGTFVYHSGRTRVKDYIRMTGGATPGGDLSRAFVIKANGRIISSYFIDEESRVTTLFRDKFLNALIFPGDTVIVPPAEPRVSFMEHLKDWTTILYQLASTVKITTDVWK